MRKHTSYIIFIVLVLFLTATVFAQSSIVNNTVNLQTAKLPVGSKIDLTGQWAYRPDYTIQPGEKIESTAPGKDDFQVGVPQFLNRVRWWLDDSEDFKKFEDARLKKLGFDTDKAEEGWYKLNIDADTIPKEKRIFIEFDGVAMKSRVFLNGHELGNHTGMFSRFEFDLTPYLKPGKNLLAVFVSMERIPVSTASMGTAVTVNLTASKVLSLSKGMFGPLTPVPDNRAYDLHGIWQPVHLEIRGRAELDDVYFIALLDGAQVNVEAHAADTAQPAILKAKWLDPKTDAVFATSAPQNINLDTAKTTATVAVNNIKPKLWTPADPNLYKMEVTIESPSGEILDKYTQNVGFRTFEVRGNQLYLNGHRYWLRGVNQLPYGKNPWDNALPRKLIQALHDNNERMTRTHATPWNEAWLDAADEIGLGVSIEGIRPWAFVGKIGATPNDLFQHWLMENADVVKRIRNHPSVLIWTVGNEMLLRDNDNVEKWRQLSDVVKQTRALDATRPVIVSSSYVRESGLYDKVIKPNNIDDGDIDDLHSYKGWYADSPFVTDSLFEKELKDSDKWKRPFIGQEMATGYPDLDTGLPVFTYTKNQVSPQAWVGVNAYPGSDPAYFLEHQKIVTKRWAEQLRFQRGDRTSGFILFSAECWFSHSFDSNTLKAYPVLDSVKYAWAPVGLALETAQRRFFSGQDIKTSVFVTNDDEQFRDFSDLSVRFSLLDESGRPMSSNNGGALSSLRYYETAKVPVDLKMPNGINQRTRMTLVTHLYNGTTEISRTVDPVEVFPDPIKDRIKGAHFATISVGPEIAKAIPQMAGEEQGSGNSASVLIVGKGASLDEGLKAGGDLYKAAAGGATVIVLSPGKAIQDVFPNDVLSVRKVNGEYADPTPAAGTKIVENLQANDIKWWARNGDWRTMVAGEAHRLNPSGTARELIRFIPAHGYIAAEKIPEQMMTVLFEIPIGKGRIWVCDLDIEESVGTDPAARLFFTNLLRAAQDPKSTVNLIKMPTHEEMLAGKRP